MGFVVLLLDPARDDVDFRLCLSRTDARLEPANQVGSVHKTIRQLTLGRLKWNPEVGWLECKLKTRRQHSDDRVALAVQRQRATNDARVAAKFLLPQSVSEDGEFRPIWLVLAALKCATENRIDAEQCKEVGTCSWCEYEV